MARQSASSASFAGTRPGIRTMGLVCLGAAIFGEVSIVTGESRVAAGVVQGIGFIGAGIVFQRGNWIVGLTTAATAWAVAGIGLAVAYDLFLTAILVTAAIVIILELEKGH
ncbi:MAG: MgtC/SapB family protein [Dehalococcoidia bacterium]|nr:MgtC/SapB family protein [Dehalococcoidia bacterium]